MARRFAVAAAAAALAAPCARPVLAQDAPAMRVRCRGQIVSDIQVRTAPPFNEGERVRWYEAPVRWINSAHATTDPEVVMRYLLIKPGDACDERQRAESERILRVMPFLASASVVSVTDGQGGVRLIVDTRDELSTVMSVSARGARMTGFSFGNRNLGGKGVFGAVQWHDGQFDDQYGARVSDYQFLGRRIFLDLEGRRTYTGNFEGGARMTRPYLTDQQRVAWRVSGSSTSELFPFFRGANLDAVDVELARTFLDIGGLVRVGVPGRLSLFGVSFSRETDVAGMPDRPDSLVNYGVLLAPFGERRNARVNALWALRKLSFRPMERVDFISAEQDVPIGLQISTLFGRSLSVFGATDDDIFVAAGLQAGLGGGSSFVRLDARAEGRQNYDTNQWDGIIGGGRLTAYQRMGERQTMVAVLDWAAGWNHRIPFQLSLGDARGGVRGYKGSREAGSQRTVVRLEDRLYLTGIRSRADLGLALFADAGRIRAGDAQYGIDSPVRAGVGVGILAAVPRGAKRNYRLDVAYALSDDGRGKRWEVRLSTLSATRVEWREPRDLARSRERATPDNLFP